MTPPQVAEASERLVDLPGRGIGSASGTLVSLGERRGYTVGAVGPGSFRLERSVRPVWATALAIVTMPLLGLGIVFLRMRNRESAMVTIYEERSGTKARVVGDLDAEIIEHLAAPPQAAGSAPARSTDIAPAGDAATETPPTAQEPAPSPVPRRAQPSTDPSRIEGIPGRVSDRTPALENDDDTAATVARSSLPSAPRPSQSSTGGVAVSLPDGSIVDLTTPVIIGRLPTGDAPTRPIALANPSLSKSHVRLEATVGGVSITDLHSTNGVRIRSNGSDQICHPGRPIVIDAGATVIAGEVELRIVEAAR